MEPGFAHLTLREALAVALAFAIVADWAANRYLGRARGGRPVSGT